MNTSTPPWYTELNSDYTSEKSIDKIIASRSNRLSFSFDTDEHVQKVIENALEEDVDNRFESALDFKESSFKRKGI